MHASTRQTLPESVIHYYIVVFHNRTAENVGHSAPSGSTTERESGYIMWRLFSGIDLLFTVILSVLWTKMRLNFVIAVNK